MKYVVVINTKVVLVRGYQAGTLLRSTGLKPIWSGTGRGWVLDRKRLPDVRAALESRGCRYREVGREDAA